MLTSSSIEDFSELNLNEIKANFPFCIIDYKTYKRTNTNPIK
jgi:hypothetical protein